MRPHLDRHAIYAIALVIGIPPALAQLPEMEVVPPPMQFESSEAHYRYLLEQANNGTRHTIESVPQWLGLWEVARSDSINDTFLDADGNIRDGVLTQPYEEHFRERRRQIEETGQQFYDRLTHCEPAGYPRNLTEPYIREFVNMPHQTWNMNDLANEIRRVYINDEHINLSGGHTWLGDTIGFWDGDRLITHTVDVMPVDYFRGYPITSNQFEGVEIWELKTFEDGQERLEVQATFYDFYALQKPVSIVYGYTPAIGHMDAKVRIRHFECETNANSYLAEDGTTQFYLPGEDGYTDPRGSTLFPDVPGQSRDPVFNVDLFD